VMLLQYANPTNGNGISLEWVKYMNGVFPEMACLALGLFLIQQIPLHQMGSGVVGTAYFNTLKMTLLIDELRSTKNKPLAHKGLDWSSDDLKSSFAKTSAFERSEKSVGVLTKIEYVVDITDYDVALKPSPGMKYPSYDLDLLGFDTCPFVIDDDLVVQLPVLQVNRRYKSWLYLKNHYDKKRQSQN